MEEAGSYRFYNASLSLTFFLERTAIEIIKKVYGWSNRSDKWLRLQKPDKVGNRRLPKVATSRVLRLQGGKQSFKKLPRRLFLATSFSSGWLGKQQAIFSIGKIRINKEKNRPEWWGRRPSLLQCKGGKFPFHSRSSRTTFRPTWRQRIA